MPFVFEEDLKKDISGKNFAPVYVIYGDDAYLKKHYKDTIAKKAFDGDPFFNMQKFDGDIDLQEVYDAVNQFPIMASKKSVLIEDFDFMHTDNNSVERLCTLIEDVGDTCVLILYFDNVEFDIKKNAAAKKIVNAVNKAGGKCAEINHRNIAALAKLLTDGAAKRGCRLGDSAARYLIEVSGNDLSTLQNELDKLCAYVPSGEITKEIVDNVSVKSVDASVYDFAKRIFAGDLSAALNLLDDMLFMHIEPMVILYNVSSAYVDIYRAYTAKKFGVGKNDIAKDFAYPKNKLFLIERAIASANRFDSKKLRLSLNCISEADKSLKTFGADERCILEQLTVKLVYILKKGESVD